MNKLNQSSSQTEALRYADAQERRMRIMATLESEQFVSVVDLANLLKVSGMTVRRDLRILESAGEARILHGGASIVNTQERSNFTLRSEAANAEKSAIAQCAVSLLGLSDTIAIDAGTTAFQLALALPDEFKGLVITHSLPVITHFVNNPKVNLLCLGGELLHESQAFIGQTTIETIQKLRIETLFLSAKAANAEGVYIEASNERSTKIALMKTSQRVVLLLDHTKLQAPAPVQLCTLAGITDLITDLPLQNELAAICEYHEVQVTIAKN